MALQEKMLKDLEQKSAFIKATEFAFQYMDIVDSAKVYPSEEDI